MDWSCVHLCVWNFLLFKGSKKLVCSKMDIKHYTSHNIVQKKVYSNQLFQKSCLQNQQSVTFCLVGTHWPNGIAEHIFRTLTGHWLSLTCGYLVPQHMYYTKSFKLRPLLVSGSWGHGPVYIGDSTFYSSTITLIYNLKTTHVSLQFHVLFDEYFSTMPVAYYADSNAYFKNAYSKNLYQLSPWWMHKTTFLMTFIFLFWKCLGCCFHPYPHKEAKQ